MAPIRYSLHYEDYSEHLMSRFGKLLQIQSLVDMTLMCSSHTLRVHKAVLAASSAYFQEVLQKQTGEPLVILKMRFGVLKSLVEFMYCGKTQCLEENLDELVSAAQFLKIKGLCKVTKEGLGIANSSELPVFPPPVVINRPPQSFIDLHSQDTSEPVPSLAPMTNTKLPVDSLARTNKDTVVRIPFDIEKGGNATSSGECADVPRAIKPRRGRPSSRRTGGWEGTGPLGRAAERVLLRREQDSRKAIHHLKHLQNRQMQEYMDRVTLAQAVNSICGPESSSSHNYMNIDADLMYMDQTVSSNALDPVVYTKDTLGNETITSSYTNTTTTSSIDDSSSSGISTAMSQYVNALKNAGLPTDLPILFESGDGSYINVNEQVLLDMVQSSEIQYEVIEQPNIIEKVANPSEIKSIDDLSKSIERGEMLMGNKGYSSINSFAKDTTQFNHADDAINTLNSILPDSLEAFGEQQNFVVLDPPLQCNNNMHNVNTHDFSCIDGDIQFFTKSMSDDVKKYYEEQQLDDATAVIEQFCPTSTTLDANFSISLLDTKNSQISDSTDQQYNPLTSEDLRRNDDCYDFGLQLPQNNEFKVDALDCLMSTPKRNDEENTFDDSQLEKRVQERAEIIKDLMDIERNINMVESSGSSDACKTTADSNVSDLKDLKIDKVLHKDNDDNRTERNDDMDDVRGTVTSSGLQWDSVDLTNNDIIKNESLDKKDLESNKNLDATNTEDQFDDAVIHLTDPTKLKSDRRDVIEEENVLNKENKPPNKNDETNTLENDIPYAVGLLPLKRTQATEGGSLLKRRSSIDLDLINNADTKSLKRKIKY